MCISNRIEVAAEGQQSITAKAIISVAESLTYSLALSPARSNSASAGKHRVSIDNTGNTPIMDMSIFQGMRTLSANIAVEMPESEVGSTHFRLLFLAGLVLFMFTFFFNTLAEIVRQRLRRKYSTL